MNIFTGKLMVYISLIAICLFTAVLYMTSVNKKANRLESSKLRTPKVISQNRNDGKVSNNSHVKRINYHIIFKKIHS